MERGEFVLLTGPSGCGKTTILRLINGLIPQHGKMKNLQKLGTTILIVTHDCELIRSCCGRVLPPKE